MKRFLKTAAINLGVLAVLLLVVNVASLTVVIMQKYRYVRKGGTDARIALPALVDKDRAREFFSEFYRMESRYVPFEEWRYEPFAGKAITVEESGLRRVPGSRTDGATIHFFGGSTTWGTGVWDDETIPALVGREMPTIIAVNHGQSGHVSRQELDAVLSLLNSPNPVDAIVFYDGVNDVYTLCSVASSVNGHGLEALMGAAMRRQEQRHWFIARDMFVGGILELMQLVDDKFGGGALNSSSRGSCSSDPARAQRVADTLWANWQHARRVLSERGIPFLAVLQPAAGIGHADVTYLPASQFAENANLTAVYPLLAQKIGNGESWLLDLSRAFDDAGPIFFDWAHASPKGNQIIARHMSEALSRLLHDSKPVRLATH